MRGSSRRWTTSALAILVFVMACRSRPAEELRADWQTHRTPDGALTLQLPPGYEKRNDYGCWNRLEPDESGWRDFCLELLDPGEASKRTLEGDGCQVGDLIIADCAYYEARRVDTVRFGERAAVVERALLSGTIGHYRQRPAVLVRVPLGSVKTAVLSGDHPSHFSGASDEFVAIAGTIRLASEGPP